MKPLVISVLLVAGCAHPMLVPRSAIGTDGTRQVAYLHAATFVEETPDAVGHDAILDEARLASVDGGTACIDLIERTGVGYDEPIAEMQPQCRTGVSQPAAVTSETVSVSDHDFQTHEVVARVHEVTPFGWAQTKLIEPTDAAFRVVERRARLCCPLAGSARVGVALRNPRMRVNDIGAVYGEAFSWQVAP